MKLVNSKKMRSIKKIIYLIFLVLVCQNVLFAQNKGGSLGGTTRKSPYGEEDLYHTPLFLKIISDTCVYLSVDTSEIFIDWHPVFNCSPKLELTNLSVDTLFFLFLRKPTMFVQLNWKLFVIMVIP